MTAEHILLGDIASCIVHSQRCGKRHGKDGTMALAWPLEKQGSRGENVRSIQYLLNARTSATDDLVVDGIFGPATDDAVRSFQSEHGLT